MKIREEKVHLEFLRAVFWAPLFSDIDPINPEGGNTERADDSRRWKQVEDHWEQLYDLKNMVVIRREMLHTL